MHSKQAATSYQPAHVAYPEPDPQQEPGPQQEPDPQQVPEEPDLQQVLDPQQMPEQQEPEQQEPDPQLSCPEQSQMEGGVRLLADYWTDEWVQDEDMEWNNEPSQTQSTEEDSNRHTYMYLHHHSPA
jgi:hypothetical protein